MCIAECDGVIDRFDGLSQKQGSQLSRVLHPDTAMTLASIIEIEQMLQRRVMEIYVVRVGHLELELPKRIIRSGKLHNRTIAKYHVMTSQVARIGSQLRQDLRRRDRRRDIPGRVEEYTLDTRFKFGGLSAPAAHDNACRKDWRIVTKKL